MTTIILSYILIVNLVAFVMFGIDKRRARKNQFRISEKSLLGIALIGGSAGSWLGMYLFRHKTKHWYFWFGIPFILFVQLGICCWLFIF